VSATSPAASRADQIAALLAASPPRPVPPELLRAALGQGAPLALALFGGVFVLLGALFVYLFFPWNFYRDRQLAAADTATATGRVLAVAETSLSINKRRVVRYTFSFQPAAGAPVSGECFTTGRGWNQNARVTVRYRPENPALCCIVGARLSEGDGSVAFVLVFPAVGGGLVAWVLLARRRTRALLERGFLAEARVTAVEQTNVRVNNRYVYRITLQRTDSPEGGTFIVKQSAPGAVALAHDRREAQQPVFVLYDPANPRRALLPETL